MPVIPSSPTNLLFIRPTLKSSTKSSTMHIQFYLPMIAGGLLGFAAPPPSQGFPSIEVVESFVSGQLARSCLIDAPNDLGDNICLFDNNDDPSICCPQGSACASALVGYKYSS
jgi:hypothetical protein